MRWIFLLSLISINIHLTAQSLVDTNKLWHVSEQSWGWWAGPITTHIEKFQGDTIINSTTYKILSGFYMVSYLREDSTGKVYAYNLSNDLLLYDFNLALNDTFNGYCASGTPLQAVVIAIDSIMLDNGEKRKRIDFGIMQWIEGIGSLDGLYEISQQLCYVDLSFGLTCFTENDTLKYFNTNYDSCNYFQVGINEYEQYNSIRVHPNPTTSTFTISGNYELPAAVVLYDITGRAVFQQPATRQQQQVNISSLAKGLYLWKLNDKKGTTTSGKLVKQYNP